MANSKLAKAKEAKNDEFYTQFCDIQKEIEKYLDYSPDTFSNKVVYCNCDDPFESNFFRYFALNFERLKLKKLITTSYKPSPIANTQLGLFGDDKTLPKSKDRPKITANKFIVSEVYNIDGNSEYSLKDVAKQLRENKHNEWTPLDGNGDFRSDECLDLLKQSDIVVTNPPFSLFREYVKQLFDYNKKFLIIGNINCLTYREIFLKIKENKAWLGNGMGRWISGFIVPETYNLYGTEARIDERGNRIVATNNCLWLTNLDHGRRHQPLPLMTIADNLKYSKHKEIKGKKMYDKYDNFDAIEVPFTDAIPSDYEGVMGVPVSFLDKYNPDQFDIVGWSRHNDLNMDGGYWKGGKNDATINGRDVYRRILIKHNKKI